MKEKFPNDPAGFLNHIISEAEAHRLSFDSLYFDFSTGKACAIGCGYTFSAEDAIVCDYGLNGAWVDELSIKGVISLPPEAEYDIGDHKGTVNGIPCDEPLLAEIQNHHDGNRKEKLISVAKELLKKYE